MNKSLDGERNIRNDGRFLSPQCFFKFCYMLEEINAVNSLCQSKASAHG